MQNDRRRKVPSLRGGLQGAAWLSSARAVRCRVKSHNERNPYRKLLAGNAEDSSETATEIYTLSLHELFRSQVVHLMLSLSRLLCIADSE